MFSVWYLFRNQLEREGEEFLDTQKTQVGKKRERELGWKSASYSSFPFFKKKNEGEKKSSARFIIPLPRALLQKRRTEEGAATWHGAEASKKQIFNEAGTMERHELVQCFPNLSSRPIVKASGTLPWLDDLFLTFFFDDSRWIH